MYFLFTTEPHILHIINLDLRKLTAITQEALFVRQEFFNPPPGQLATAMELVKLTITTLTHPTIDKFSPIVMRTNTDPNYTFAFLESGLSLLDIIYLRTHNSQVSKTSCVYVNSLCTISVLSFPNFAPKACCAQLI